MFTMILISLLIAGAGSTSQAEVVVQEPGTNAVFKVDGKVVPAAEASKAAESSNTKIERCTPIKDAVAVDGHVVQALRCKRVIKSLNPKNGNTTWKNL